MATHASGGGYRRGHGVHLGPTGHYRDAKPAAVGRGRRVWRLQHTAAGRRRGRQFGDGCVDDGAIDGDHAGHAFRFRVYPGGVLPPGLRAPFSAAMAQSMLLGIAALALGLVAALFMRPGAHR